MHRVSFFLLFGGLAGLSCSSASESPDQAAGDPSVPVTQVQPDEERILRRITLPPGFKISIYARNIPDARSMTRSPGDVLYVGNRRKDKVYALQDTDGDLVAETKHVIASGLTMPNGVAFYKGDLYVAEVSRLLRYKAIDQRLTDPPEPQVVYSDYPSERHHGWKYIAFGPDGKLYVPIGAPCNICESESEIFASITRMNPDGSQREVFAKGVRNTVGFAWHPDTDELWFTDNGRDWLGDELPPCELNHAPRAGLHFGYPYCHGRDIADPDFGGERNCTELRPPAQALGPHVAPLGMKFYTGNMFPEEYRGHIFIAEHGSWNRSRKIGYRITLVRLEGSRAVSYTPFASGWHDEKSQKVYGRPVDILQQPDGALLVSDDYANLIYRISYTGS